MERSGRAGAERRGTALVTGASAGIGEAIAREMAGRGYDLVLTARRADRLEGLASQLTARHGVQADVLPADLSRPEAPADIETALRERGLKVDVLVNNAGYGVTGAYLSQPWDVHETFLQVMVRAVADLTWRLSGPMRERGRGRVVNIASVAGWLPGTGGHTLYGAVKAWMISFSESLAFELEKDGVTVTAICPGFTYSEFHDVNNMRAQVSQLPKWMWMDAARVARQTVDAAERGDRIYINGRVNRLIVWMGRHLPRPLVYELMARPARRFRDVD
ncbi:MAG: SDR family oxidoreductase [Gemmatimonadota bacterium]|nr:MAG: SDR family oxidoreductase [Gemmatimonadota bacterium]